MKRQFFFVALVMVLSLFCIGVLGFMASGACAAEIRLAWDPNDPVPEGYRVFRRAEGSAYDYGQPIWQGSEITTGPIDIGAPEVPAPMPVVFDEIRWDRAASSIFVDWNQPKAEATQVDFFVVRAFDGDLESADSEEVSWTQTVEAEVARWEVFFGESADGPWTPLDVVMVNDPTRITAPFTYVEIGQTKEIFFTVVTFGADGQFSPNAAAQSVVIDRPRPPEPPSGINIELVIPVQ